MRKLFLAVSAFFSAVVAAALLALPFQELRADTAPKVIEEVDFAISCGPTSQEAFKHAAWTLHSFWYPEALFGRRNRTILASCIT